MAPIRTVCWNTQKNSNCSALIFQNMLTDTETRVVIVLEPGQEVASGKTVLGEQDSTPDPRGRVPIMGRKIDSAGVGRANENILIFWDNNFVNVESLIELNDYTRKNISSRVPIAIKISTRDHPAYPHYTENIIAAWHSSPQGDDIYTVITQYVRNAPDHNVQVIMGDFNSPREDGFEQYRLVSPSGQLTMIDKDGTKLQNAFDKTITLIPPDLDQIKASRYYYFGQPQPDDLFTPAVDLANFRAQYSDHLPIYTTLNVTA